MKLLWFSWKDIKNPLSGGAESVHDEILSRCVKDNHEVILLCARFPKSLAHETIHGYSVIRVGNRYFVYIAACLYFIRHLRKWPDLIIEEINTMPFLTQFYSSQKKILLIHQLCKEIWFYNIPFPFGIIGYIAEYLFLKILSSNTVLTISKSSYDDLAAHGFNTSHIKIIPLGIQIKPVVKLSDVKKYPQFTILSLGAMRPMKRTLDMLEAFEIAKASLPDIRLIIAGDATSRYGNHVLNRIKSSPYKKDILYVGKVSFNKRTRLLQKSHILLTTSVKEGWGLVVSEANSQGTVAISYNVDGLRDSNHHGKTGLITPQNNSQSLANTIVKMYNDKKLYNRLQLQAYTDSTSLRFEKTYNTFMKSVHDLLKL